MNMDMDEFDKEMNLLISLIDEVEKSVNKDNCNNIESIVNNYLDSNMNTELVLKNIIAFEFDMKLLKLNIVEELKITWLKDE